MNDHQHALSRRSLLAGTAAAVACAAVPRGARAATVLKFSHTDTSVGARHQAADLFAKKVGEYTAGRYEVQVFSSGQLANDPKSLEMLQLGGLDFAVTATGTYATFAKTMNLTALPYLVESYDQGWRLYDESKYLREQFELLPPKGMRIIATWEAGFRSFTTKGSLSSPAEAKGQKIRIYPNDMLRWIMESFGFNPVVLPVTEVYLAISQGTVWGQENPVDTIYSQRFYEVAKYLTLTQHVYSPIPLAISEGTWQKLSAADRDAVVRAAKEAAALSRKTVRANDGKQLDEMKAKGAVVTTPNVALFRNAALPVYDKARGVYGKDVDTLLAESDAIRKGSKRT